MSKDLFKKNLQINRYSETQYILKNDSNDIIYSILILLIHERYLIQIYSLDVY